MSRRDAARFAGVTDRTIDQWVYRGHVARHADGYDTLDLAWRILSRDDTMAAGGAVAAHLRDNPARSL